MTPMQKAVADQEERLALLLQSATVQRSISYLMDLKIASALENMHWKPAASDIGTRI